ncbi:hypothetical protein WG906_03355 [Pedobacter sp. P351]|uniref:hypothetical protein n=1 Tax=Pedobacter superstes TaxID=3133441 RepID=UPI0030A1571C
MKKTLSLLFILVLSTIVVAQTINIQPGKLIKSETLAILYLVNKPPIKTYLTNLIYSISDVDSEVSPPYNEILKIVKVYAKEGTVFLTKKEIFKMFKVPKAKYNLPILVDARVINLKSPLLGVKSNIKSVDINFSSNINSEVIQITTWERYNFEQKLKADTSHMRLWIH